MTEELKANSDRKHLHFIVDNPRLSDNFSVFKLFSIRPSRANCWSMYCMWWTMNYELLLVSICSHFVDEIIAKCRQVCERLLLVLSLRCVISAIRVREAPQSCLSAVARWRSSVVRHYRRQFWQLLWTTSCFSVVPVSCCFVFFIYHQWINNHVR